MNTFRVCRRARRAQASAIGLFFAVVVILAACSAAGDSVSRPDPADAKPEAAASVVQPGSVLVSPAGGEPATYDSGTSEPTASLVVYPDPSAASTGELVSVRGTLSGAPGYEEAESVPLWLLTQDFEYASAVAFISLDDGAFETTFEVGTGEHTRPVEPGIYFFALGYEQGSLPLVVDTTRVFTITGLSGPAWAAAGTPLTITDVNLGGPPDPNVWSVTVSNRSADAVSLDGWVVADLEPPTGRFEMPQRYLEPGERLVIWYGQKDNEVCDREDFGNYVFFCNRDADGDGYVFTTWNMFSDEAVLLTPDGATVSTWRYPAGESADSDSP